MGDAIEFPAQVARVQTLADGGLRVTLDLPESAILAVAELMTCKRFGQVLRVVCTAQSVEAVPSGDELDAEYSFDDG